MKDHILDKWDEIMENLRTEYNITNISYNTWLKDLRVKEIVDNTVIIISDNPIIGSNYSFIQDKYSIFIMTAIAEITGYEVEIKIEPNSGTPATVKIPETKITNPEYKGLTLISDYTFENFVVSKNNSFAHVMALKVAEAPGEYCNPLYIYGDPGLGKTHLMQSIAHFILENSPSLKVMYVTSEVFTNELIDAIRNGNSSATADFRAKYRNIDVLLIDDIQFIIGKDYTQQEFFHTFNALYEEKKQIVISSDKPPKDFNDLEERLKSRFDWGLIVDLTSPDFETKMAILKKKIDIKNREGYIINIDDSVLAYIAENVNTNIRVLEGALNKIIALSRMQRNPVDIELAKYALRDIVYPNQKKVITPDTIIEIVAEHYDISVAEIMSQKRDKYISVPRQIAMYLAKKYTSASTTDLGKTFNRDHSTIIHGIDNIEEKITTDPEIASKVSILIKKLNIE